MFGRSNHWAVRGSMVSSLHDRHMRIQAMNNILLADQALMLARGARVAQWWEHLPPTNVARVQIPASTPYVGWICCWFSPLLREVFLRVLRFSPLLKNQHFQIPIWPGIRQTKNHHVDVLPANRYLFILFIYFILLIYLLYLFNGLKTRIVWVPSLGIKQILYVISKHL